MRVSRGDEHKTACCGGNNLMPMFCPKKVPTFFYFINDTGQLFTGNGAEFFSIRVNKKTLDPMSNIAPLF